MLYLSTAMIRAAILAALPRLRGDTAKRDRWAALFAGWLAPATGTATTITAPTTGTASNVARRAWKHGDPLKGTVPVSLSRWTFDDLMVKVSTATPTVASQRIAITQAVDKVQAAVEAILADKGATLDAIPEVAVSVDPTGEGVIVTAYYHDHGEVRPGG